MSITKAMNSGVSGMSAESDALGVVGDNVANVNTVGFKRSRANFEDVLGGVMGGPGQIGSGVRMARAQQIFAQGTILNTGEATDVALSGDGFFVVKGSLGGVDGTFYTRAGQLTLRNDGVLVNPNGMAVQGYRGIGGGQFDNSVSDIQLSTAALPPQGTSKIALTANLDANAVPPALPFDPQNPSSTSNLSTSITVYDSLGKAHAVDVYFRSIGGGQWEMHALAKGDELTSGPAGQNVEIAGGTMSFTSTGALADFQLTNGGTMSFTGATQNQPITIDVGTPISQGGTGLGGTTQFGAASAVTSQSQDGYTSGDLAGVKIEQDGTVSGVYSNGQTVAAGKLAIAKFRANDGLARAGKGLWTTTRESGEAALGSASTGGRGALVAGAVEQSNVDVAEQFVELINHQRAFQANSKTITTADEMLQEVMQLKR